MYQSLDANKAIDVSVIMPAYNAQSYISKAIRSVQAQTISNFELIIIDDASTDATSKIIKDFLTDDSRIKYARMTVNAGPAASRNHGLNLAKGEWIALLDADDHFHPDRLKTLLEFGKYKNADIVSDNIMLIDENRNTEEKMIPESIISKPKLLLFEEFIRGCYYDAQTPARVRYVFMHPIFQRRFLEHNSIRYNEISRTGEDFLFYVDCYIKNAKWYIVPDPMYFYTIRKGSLTETASDQDYYIIIQKMKAVSKMSHYSGNTLVHKAARRHWRLIASDYYYYGLKNALRTNDHRRMWRAFTCDKDAFCLITLRLIGRSPQFLFKFIGNNKYKRKKYME